MLCVQLPLPAFLVEKLMELKFHEVMKWLSMKPIYILLNFLKSKNTVMFKLGKLMEYYKEKTLVWKLCRKCGAITGSKISFFLKMAGSCICNCHYTMTGALWFSDFLIFCDLFHEPLSELSNSKVWETRKYLSYCTRLPCDS